MRSLETYTHIISEPKNSSNLEPQFYFLRLMSVDFFQYLKPLLNEIRPLH